MKQKRKKRISGAAAIKLAGGVPALVKFTPEQKDAIDQARALDGRTLTGFVSHYAAQAARDILAKDE